MENIEQRIARSFNAQGLMQTLGAKLAFVADGEVHVALPFAKSLSQQHGFIHAGAITSANENRELTQKEAMWCGLYHEPQAPKKVVKKKKVKAQ